MIKFVVISRNKGNYFHVHTADCADLNRGENKHRAYENARYTVEAESTRALLDQQIKEVCDSQHTTPEESGWGDSSFDVFPCCTKADQAATKAAVVAVLGEELSTPQPMQTELKSKQKVLFNPQGCARDRLADLLCSAFEGGSNYWYLIVRYTVPTTFEVYSDLSLSGGTPEKPHITPYLDYPLNPGGAVIIRDIEGDFEHNGLKEWTLDLDACFRGLTVMHDKYPHHYSDFLKGNDDATTGDVYLQCCLFGELIFG